MAKIITLTGEAGCGKTSIARKLLTYGFAMVTSSTTRTARPSDIYGEYEYLSLPQFWSLERQGAFIWTTEYAGNRYGTRYTYVDAALKREKPGIMILVPEVVPKLLRYTQEVLPFFICTPSEELLRCRLQERGDSPADIEQRLQSLQWEQQARRSDIPYLYITNTGTLEDAVEQIRKHV